MPPNECIPFFEPGARLTGKPTVAVTGKRFVKLTGNRNADGTFAIGPPTAAGRVFGVASYDAAIGARVTIIRGPGNVVPVTCAADIAAFAEVQVDGTGAVITLAGGVAVGFAVSGAANGNDAPIALY